MCPSRHIQLPDGYISRELWEKLIDEITESSPEAVVLPFWRGESLLHPEFTELMTYALDRSIKIHISTNGHVIKNSHYDVLERCDFVTFSMHTTKGYINAEQFLSRKKKGLPVVQLSFIKGEKTADKLLYSIVTAPDLNGFDSIRLYEEHSTDGVFGKSAVSLNNIDRVYCPKLLNTLIISHDGTVSRCNHIWETEDKINLNKITISEAWSSGTLNKIRDNYPDDRCNQCDQWIGHTLGESWRVVNGIVEHKVFST